MTSLAAHNMNKFFRKSRVPTGNRSQSMTVTSLATDKPRLPVLPSELGNDGPLETDATVDESNSEPSDVVLRLQVPTVPKIRSSSFDSGGLLLVRSDEGCGTGGGEFIALDAAVNAVPTDGCVSSTIDRTDPTIQTSLPSSSSSSSLLKVVDLPKCFRRRSLDIPRLCIHCVHLESIAASSSVATGRGSSASGDSSPFQAESLSDDSSSDSDQDIDDARFQLVSKTSPREINRSESDNEDNNDETPSSQLRATSFSPTRHPPVRTIQPLADDNTNGSDEDTQTMTMNQSPNPSSTFSNDKFAPYDHNPEEEPSSGLSSTRLPHPPLRVIHQGPSVDVDDLVMERCSSGGSNLSSIGSMDGSDWKEIVTLQVPLIKPRSSSLDASYYSSNGSGVAGTGRSSGDGSPSDGTDDRRCSCENLLVDSSSKQRSTSVDVSLPTDASGGTYKAITLRDQCGK